MTNHQVWTGFSWFLYAGTIMRGAYRASGINKAMTLNVTSGSQLLVMFMLASVLVFSTGQFPSFFTAFFAGLGVGAVLAALLFVLRRHFEWRETLAEMAARARASGGLKAQAGRSEERPSAG